MSAANPRKRVLTTVHLDPEQRDALKRISARTRIPQAVLYRQALDLVIAMYDEPKKTPLGEEQPRGGEGHGCESVQTGSTGRACQAESVST